MPSQKALQHNWSPLLFDASQLDLTWLETWYGLLTTLCFFGAGFAFAALHARKQKSKGKDILGALLFAFALTVLLALLVFLYFMFKNQIPWGLRWYSTMYVVAFVQLFLVLNHWVKKRHIMLTSLMLDSLIGYLIVGMIVGARCAYVFVYNWQAYAQHPEDILRVWEGGLSFHGGIIGVTLAIFLYAKRHGIPFFHLADRLSLCVPFGIGMGRIGNFMNGELYGRVTDVEQVPWAMIFQGGGPLPRHPSQLYESFSEGWLLLLTLILIHRSKPKEGTLAASFLFFYGLYRFFTEFFREADPQLSYFFGQTVTMGQILSVASMLVGGTIFALTRKGIQTGSEEWQGGIDEYFEKRKLKA
jgi:phosphatidylglycerol:prolipoprotein diacylglycerol transferase